MRNKFALNMRESRVVCVLEHVVQVESAKWMQLFQLLGVFSLVPKATLHVAMMPTEACCNVRVIFLDYLSLERLADHPRIIQVLQGKYKQEV